ncbi:hypothetical protein E2K80_02090 [Rhodophyticola sp. CCM32]|nr:hypothetical protein E2K80_02090 [Rhodophyticola sp. CCM32]
MYKPCVAILKAGGFDKAFLYERSHVGHLASTYQYLDNWGCDEETKIAGLMHSVIDPKSGYDNEILDLSTMDETVVPKRAKALIIGYYCLERSEAGYPVEAGEFAYDGRRISLSQEDIRSIADIAVADRIDQVDWCWEKHDIAPTADVMVFLESSKHWAALASGPANSAFETTLSSVRETA